MSVSSVKNLNGETFSAVQDADLTTVVQTNSASWGAGSTPTYDYTDNNLISAIDTSGLFAQGLLSGSKIGRNIAWDAIGSISGAQMWLNPDKTPFTTKSGIFSPLTYATGATITYGSSGYPETINTQIFGGFFKGNEWYVSNATAEQALRGETHNSRGVHISGAYSNGRGFDLSVSAVSGKNDTANNYNWKLERGCVSGKGNYGEWRYGPAEDTALRTASAWNDTIDVVQANSGTWGQGGSDSNIFFIEATFDDDDYTVTSNSSEVENALNNNKVMALRITGNNSVENNVITDITSYEYDSEDNYANIHFTLLKDGKEYRYRYEKYGSTQHIYVQEYDINQDYNTTNTITVNNSNHTLEADAATVLTTASSGMTFNNANFEISPTSGLLKLDITTVTNHVTGTLVRDDTRFNVSDIPINNIYYYSTEYDARIEYYDSSDEPVDPPDTTRTPPVDGVVTLDFTQLVGDTSWGEISYIVIANYEDPETPITLSYDASTVVKIPYIAVPSAPATGNYVLKCVNGVTQWVEETTNSTPSNNNSSSNEGVGGNSDDSEYDPEFG